MVSKPAVQYPSIPQRSTGAALALAVLAYVAGMATFAWINVAVLCRGDAKFGYCGGAEFEMVGGPVLFAPVLVAGLLAARTNPSRERRARLYMVATAATLAVALCVFALGHVLGFFVGIVVGVAIVVNVVRAVGRRWTLEDPGRSG